MADEAFYFEDLVLEKLQHAGVPLNVKALALVLRESEYRVLGALQELEKRGQVVGLWTAVMRRDDR